MTKPIRPKFCVGPHVAPGRFMNDKNFKYLSPIKIRCSLNFRKFTKFLVKIHRENMFTIKIEDECEAPLKFSLYK